MNKSILQRLKDRYFRPVIKHPDGHLGHHGDCNIWAYELEHCDCGFIHDLDDIHFYDKLYGQYDEDYRKIHKLKKPTKEEIEQAEALLYEIFGVKDQSPEDEKDQLYWQNRKKEVDLEEWNLIEEVFGSEFRKRREQEWAEQSEKV